MAGDPTQMYNPNTMGGLSGGGGGPSMPDGPPINGGRPLGIFPGDVQFGLSKGLQGWSGTSVMNGGLFGIFSSNQKGAGFFMRILSSIRDDMLSFAKNDPGPAAFQGPRDWSWEMAHNPPPWTWLP